MTTEKDLRDVLSAFAIGLEVHNGKHRDSLHMYPSQSKHIHKMTLSLGCHLDKVTLRELLFYCLSTEDYGVWNAKEWKAFL